MLWRVNSGTKPEKKRKNTFLKGICKQRWYFTADINVLLNKMSPKNLKILVKILLIF